MRRQEHCLRSLFYAHKEHKIYTPPRAQWATLRKHLQGAGHCPLPIPAPPKMAVREENISEEVIRYLVTIGTWAPSADNCQPSRPLYPFLMHRCVNRKPYRRQKIAHDVVQKLRHVVAETPGASMF